MILYLMKDNAYVVILRRYFFPSKPNFFGSEMYETYVLQRPTVFDILLIPTDYHTKTVNYA